MIKIQSALWPGTESIGLGTQREFSGDGVAMEPGLEDRWH